MPNYPTYKLGEICIIERGGSPRPIKDYLTKDDNGLNWIKIGDATLSNKYIYTTAEKIKPEGLSKTRMVESGDLILSNSMSFGRPYIMRTSGCIHDGWVVFRLDKEIIDEEYLYNILNSNEVYAQFSHLATGSTVKNLNIDRVKEVVIPLPPLPTQHAIVTRIETLFAELDKGVEKLKTAQQQLKVYRQAVLNDCLTKGSEKWNCIEIEKVADVVSGYAFKSNLFKEVGTFQVIRIGNVKPGKIRKNENPVFYEDVPDKVLEKTLLKCNDVVITLTGTRKKRDYGFTALIDCENLLLNQRLAYFRFNQSIYNPKFFLYYTWTDLFKDDFFSYETGNVGQGNVGVKAITKTKIPLPSLPEQQRIVQEIETRLSACDVMEKNIAEALQQAEALRQSILKKAFEGELV